MNKIRIKKKTFTVWTSNTITTLKNYQFHNLLYLGLQLISLNFLPKVHLISTHKYIIRVRQKEIFLVILISII